MDEITILVWVLILALHNKEISSGLQILAAIMMVVSGIRLTLMMWHQIYG